MNYKHSCVIDAEKNYKTLVREHLDKEKNGKLLENIQYYKLRDGETLVDAPMPSMRPYAGASGLVRPRWDVDTAAWVEGATVAEIAAWEAEHPAPELPGPTPQEDADAMLVDHEYRLTLLELGVAEGV